MAGKKRRTAAVVVSGFPQLPNALWKGIIRHLFRFGRRPVVTALVCRRLRACTAQIAAEKIECDPEQLALFNVMTSARGGSIMCVVKDAVHLSVSKLKAYAHHQAPRHPRGYYLVFPKASIADMIADHGGFDALEARRLKQLASKRKRAQTVKQRLSSRAAELDAALGALGVQRRSDSRLCDEFLAGASKHSASQVASVMARMKYYHEYCGGFIRELEQAEAQVEAEVELTAEKNRQNGVHYLKECDDRGYFRGIHSACMHEVLGTDSWSEYKDGLMERYPLPFRWPWLP